MYAIVTTGGKQYKVCENDVINVEKLSANVGDKINVYVVDVKPGRQQIKLSIKEFKKKMQREEISQYMSNNDDSGDSAYTLGSVINKNS